MTTTSITRTALAFLAAFTPVAALAQGVGIVQQNSGGTWGIFYNAGTGFGVCTTTICGVAQNILYIINGILVPVLFALAFIVFLYGVADAYIFSRGDEEAVKRGHKLILWGIIGFVVMVSLWGLVNVVANTFGLAGSYAPPTPRSF